VAPVRKKFGIGPGSMQAILNFEATRFDQIGNNFIYETFFKANELLVLDPHPKV
jgi:hypothetical protein